MAERESTDHSPALPEVSGEVCGNAEPVETLDSYLKLAEQCMDAVRKLPARKFNSEQCEYLAQKLEEVLHSANTFLEVSRGKCHASSSPMDFPRGVEIFRLLSALAIQIERFVQDCCENAWIQAAMTLTNVSEYVSSVGFNLELFKVAFCKACAASHLTADEVDDINRGEVEIVEPKAAADVNALFDKLILEMPSFSNEKKDLAIYLLQRLRRVKSITGSALSGYSMVSANDGGFWGKLFRRVQETVRLGTCGSGATVDKAMWLGKVVAVKTFYGPEDPEFMKEVDIIRGLSHPNITSMFCSAMDRRRCSIVMELMDEDLHALMQRRLDAHSDSPPFTILEAVSIMLQIGEGVGYLHNRRIVHRDLKSLNVLIKSVKVGESEIGYVHVKVADFGLSKMKETNTRFSNLTSNTGTNKWMAPEIINLRAVGGSQESNSGNVKMPKYPFKVDTYSFAMVCYEILTGHVPFPEIKNPTVVKRMVLNGDRPNLPNHCPPKLKQLIEECWNQEPLKRPFFHNICKRLRHILSLLMTSSLLTREEPLQREMKGMPSDANEKPLQSSMVDIPLEVSTTVKPSLIMELARDTRQHHLLEARHNRMKSVSLSFDPEHKLDFDHILEPTHEVFVCYSGAQKDFAEQLVVDMERLGIYSFSDKSMNCLPKGTNFPKLIFDAIQHCQLGILIISEEFFSLSKWPMLELSAMVMNLERPDSNLTILPVYAFISPFDTLNLENRKRWILRWAEWAMSDNRIDVESWMKALDFLGSLNGLIANKSRGSVFFQKEVVKAALNLLSSKNSSRGESKVQGRSRLYEVLRKKINEQHCSGVRVIGLYGMAGIGKSTICKVVCDELFENFLGRVCYAELKTVSEVELLRHVLRRLINISDKLLSNSNIDQYYDRLRRHIHGHRVLLVIDNVSDSLEEIEQAKNYLKAEYAPGSVVLVATRTLGILQSLNIDERNCLEMPKLEEEEARSLFIYYAAPVYEVGLNLLERCMWGVKQYFSSADDYDNYHYHPIALREFGLQLGYHPERWEEKLAKRIDRRLNLYRPKFEFMGLRKSFDMLTLGSRPSFLRKSFDMLGREDQILFMDAALFYLEPPEHSSTLKQLNIFKWLSLVHGISVDAVMKRLEDLKNKLLLEHLGDGSQRIGMHPLVREFCESEAIVGEPEIRRWVYNNEEILEDHVLSEHASCWENMRRICLRGSGARKKLNLKYCTNVTVLKLVRCHFENHVLDLSPLTSLKSLEILSCTSSMSESSSVEILGLGLLSNLVVLKWDSIPSMSSFIEVIGLLTELRFLELESSINENNLPDVGRLSLLKEAVFRFGDGAYTITGLSRELSSLQVLDLGGCHRLLTCPGIGDVVALQELDLSDCLELEELPDLQNLINLKKLYISGCRSIRALPGLDGLDALQELELRDCSLLQGLPRHLWRLRRLRKLEMRGCLSITSLPGLGDLFALKELDLQGCSRLGQLPYLGDLKHLRKLNITECCLIEAVPGLNDLISLQEFQAERCSELVELPDIRILTNLLVLNVSLER